MQGRLIEPIKHVAPLKAYQSHSCPYPEDDRVLCLEMKKQNWH